MKENIRSQFPIFKNHPHLIYFDSAATTLKPRRVIRAIVNYYEKLGANVHRGIYQLAEKSTIAFEEARQEIASFINASPQEIIFVRNTSEAINLVVLGFLEKRLKRGDLILSSILEHHSNYLPYWQLAKKKGASFLYAPLKENGRLDLEFLEKNLQKASFLAITAASNLTGEVPFLEEIIQKANKLSLPTLLDAAQAAAHLPLDVKKLPVDFLAFSGHKVYGPTGIGILYVRKEKQKELSPLFFGGEMVITVRKNNQPVYNQPPYYFEAGTPAIAEAIGLSEAIKFIKDLGWRTIIDHEQKLSQYMLEKLLSLKEVKLIGPKTNDSRLAIFSFVIEGIHPHDLAQFLDQYEIAVRAGQVCAAPAVHAFGREAVVRASLAIYNQKTEIDKFIMVLKEAINFLKR